MRLPRPTLFRREVPRHSMVNRSIVVAISVTLCSVVSSCGADAGGTGPDEPLKIMTIASFDSATLSVPQVQTAVEAAVADVNARGGIDRRVIEAEFCNDRFDPNEAAACAARAVDEGVAALVGNVTAFPAPILATLEAAQIPLVAGSASAGPPELQSSISYPITAGAAGMNMTAGAVAVRRGGATVAIIHAADDAGRAGAADAEKGVEQQGGNATLTVMQTTSPDSSAAVAAALQSDPDAVVVNSQPQEGAQVVSSLRQAGFGGLIVGTASLFPQEAIEALGDDAEGILVTGRTVPVTATDVPEVQEFRDALLNMDPEATVDDLGLNAWTGVQLLDEVLTGREVTNGESIIRALEDIDQPIQLGTVPDYEGPRADPPNPELPRVSVFAASVSEIRGGELVSLDMFVNPMESG